MISIKKVVAAALKADADLVNLLRGPYVYRQAPEEMIDLEKQNLIVYNEASKPLERGDEEELVAEITIQIDIYSLKSTSDIAMVVDRIMVSLGGERKESGDNDQDVPRQCYSMIYTFVVDNEGMIY